MRDISGRQLCQCCVSPVREEFFFLEKDNVEVFPKKCDGEIAAMSFGYASQDRAFAAENALFPFFM